MKGIVLAGGHGTRLYPITRGVSKQLLPVYDKPMIYYPISVLMLAGIREILIISLPETISVLRKMFGNGSHLGLQIAYAEQERPGGIAEAFLIGESFIGRESVCLILGDNIFFGHGLSGLLQKTVKENTGATIFAYYVKDPERYGIITFDAERRIQSIEEKPKRAKSHWAVTGLYFYDAQVVDVAKSLRPSARGELEITDVNNVYLKKGKLKVELLGRGYAWLDTGTYDALIDASVFIKTLEDRQGLKVGCLEELAYTSGAITAEALQELADQFPTSYGEYLHQLIKRGRDGA